MIDDLNGFYKFLRNNTKSTVNTMGKRSTYFENQSFGEIFCPTCGATRRCMVEAIFGCSYEIKSENQDIIFSKHPALFNSICLQCGTTALLLIYVGPEEKIQFVILHDCYGGCVTPHTPKEVKYYIDQAYRSRSMGATSAAMSMYRSALEWLLYEQGYQSGMLGQKVNALEAAIKSGTAPKWAMEIDTDFLLAIKEIGNGSIHTNNGNISLQENIDQDSIRLVDIVFSELLDKIYEQPLRSQTNKVKLQSLASLFKH